MMAIKPLGKIKKPRSPFEGGSFYSKEEEILRAWAKDLKSFRNILYSES
jgi:hypothetical protein